MGNYSRRNKELFMKRKKKKKIRFYLLLIILICLVFVGVQKMFFSKPKSGEVAEQNVLTTGDNSSESGDNKSDNSSTGTTDDKSKDKDKDKDEETTSAYSTDIAVDSTKVRDMLKSGNYTSQGKKRAFLTFDDGPSTTVTPKVLDILKEEKVHGTFFLIGNEIEKTTKTHDIMKRIVEEGNSVANHTYSHSYKLLYPGGKIDATHFMEEVEKTNNIIADVLGEKYRPRVLRFPGGHMSWKGTSEVDKLMNEKGYVYVDWDCLVGDAEGIPRNAAALKQRFDETKVKYAKNGDLVILMHDTYGKEATAETLKSIIDELKGEGYEFRTLM